MPTHHEHPTIYLSPKALASRWGVTEGHLANLRCTGQGLIFVKIGTSVRYPLTEVEAAERGERAGIFSIHAPIGGAA